MSIFMILGLGLVGLVFLGVVGYGVMWFMSGPFAYTGMNWVPDNCDSLSYVNTRGIRNSSAYAKVKEEFPDFEEVLDKRFKQLYGVKWEDINAIFKGVNIRKKNGFPYPEFITCIQLASYYTPEKIAENRDAEIDDSDDVDGYKIHIIDDHKGFSFPSSYVVIYGDPNTIEEVLERGGARAKFSGKMEEIIGLVNFNNTYVEINRTTSNRKHKINIPGLSLGRGVQYHEYDYEQGYITSTLSASKTVVYEKEDDATDARNAIKDKIEELLDSAAAKEGFEDLFEKFEVDAEDETLKIKVNISADKIPSVARAVFGNFFGPHKSDIGSDHEGKFTISFSPSDEGRSQPVRKWIRFSSGKDVTFTVEAPDKLTRAPNFSVVDDSNNRPNVERNDDGKVYEYTFPVTNTGRHRIMFSYSGRDEADFSVHYTSE